MSVITTLSTALPSYSYSSEELERVTSSWLSSHPSPRALFERLLTSSKVGTRYFCRPIDEILSLGGQASRAAIFHKEGRSLVEKTLTNLFDSTLTKANDIDALIFTSCSVPIIPSLDTYVVERFGLNRNLTRIPLYQHGCVGGAVGLGLGSKFNSALVVSLELCSLVFQADDTRGANIVGSALFSDGCGAALLEQSGHGLKLIDSLSFLIPESSHLMGYSVLDDGAHLALDRELPQVLSDYVPSCIQQLLSRNSLKINDVSYRLFHPGGARILTILEEAFNLSREQTAWSWEVLREFGNMSSATLLFVLDKFTCSPHLKRGEYAIGLGVGPGLTLQFLLYELT